MDISYMLFIQSQCQIIYDIDGNVDNLQAYFVINSIYHVDGYI